MDLRLALAGDAILTREVSQIEEPRALAVFERLQSADIAVMNCETVFHDYAGPEVYPSAEGGWIYERSAPKIAEEFNWLGVKLVSTANNHSLDYSIGGLKSTLRALEQAGVSAAGTGHDLATARAPGFAETAKARVALVSMASGFAKAARAGRPFGGVPGRPGLNPLGYHFEADADTVAQVVDLATKFGSWIADLGNGIWEVNPPGLHCTVTRFDTVDEPGARMAVDEGDAEGNLASIRSARGMADLVIVHIHNHEWDTASGELQRPPRFIQQFARQALDAGADVVVAQGSHAPIRGIEIYDGKPIFYDLGDIFLMSRQVTRFPSDYYERHSLRREGPPPDATLDDALRMMAPYFTPMNPPGGYYAGIGECGVVPTLQYREGKLVSIEIQPFVHERGAPLLNGVPLAAGEERAEEIIAKLNELSAEFGTTIRREGTLGIIDLEG